MFIFKCFNIQILCTIYWLHEQNKNNTPVDNARNLDVVTLMHNAIESSNNYGKTPGSWWQYHKYRPIDNILEPESFKFKGKITRKTPADDIKEDV